MTDTKKGNIHQKKGEKTFSKKNIKHDPQAESARAVSGLKDQTENTKNGR